MQFGGPRTGSTFQMTLLCLAARLRRDTVTCMFAPNASAAEARIRANPNVVVKMHVAPPPSCDHYACYVFTSHTTTAKKWPQAV